MTQELWDEACRTHYLLRPKSPLLHGVNKRILAFIDAMEGDTRESFDGAVHQAIYLNLVHWHRNRGSFGLGVKKAAPKKFDVAGSSLRVRVSSSRQILLDVYGSTGFIQNNTLQINSPLPSVVLDGLIGRRVGDIIESDSPLVDPERKVIGAYLRTGTQTIVSLSEADAIRIEYHRLFGDPARHRVPRANRPPS